MQESRCLFVLLANLSVSNEGPPYHKTVSLIQFEGSITVKQIVLLCLCGNVETNFF
jgi:hypothetical protein